MRVVIKPFGLALVLIAVVGGLVIIALLPRAKNTAVTEPVGTTATPAATATPDPNNLFTDPEWRLYVENPAMGTMERIIAPDNPSQITYHYVTTETGPKQWSIGVTCNFPKDTFVDKEPLTLHFEAKSPEKVQVCLLMQRNSKPFPHSWKKNVTLTPDWQPYDFTLTTDQYGPNEAVFAIQLGLKKGTADFKNLRLERKK